MIAIVDTGGANLTSIKTALLRLGAQSVVTADRVTIALASHVILPGVGSADVAMANIRQQGLADFLPVLTQPVLGICLGFQLLFAASDEGDTRCLGILPGRVERLRPTDLPVPQMGWNNVSVGADDPLLAGVPDGGHFYFVHSFRAPATEYATAWADYGGPFAAVVRRGNFHGTQFHPEKSGPLGAKVLANFLQLRPS